MELTYLDSSHRDVQGHNKSLEIGAAVVRANRRGGLSVEFGPADGPPHLALSMSKHQAKRLMSTIHAILADGGEAIMIVE